ncbi:MAG: hypothetical protein M3178_13630 [Pseudomonadota bacterium]|nr:hypothetical protein [Pseudomonadota bacterium]
MGTHGLSVADQLERVPIKWNHLIDKDALKLKDLEHVGIEKVEQLFLDMPSEIFGCLGMT